MMMKKKPYPTSTSSLRILQASASGVRCFCLLGAVVLTSGPGSGFTSLAHAQERKDKETAPGVWPQVPQSPMTRPHPVADPGSAPAAIPVDGDVSKPAPAGDAGSAAVPAEPVAPFSPNGSIQVTRPADAQFERAMMLLNNKNWAAAINEFNNFIRGYPRHGKREEALYRIAEAYREINRPADAMLAFEYLIQTFPNSVFTPAAQLRLGHMYYLKGTYDKAVALLTPALKGDASVRVPARYLLGLTLLNMGKYEDGRVVLLELINATPPSDYAAHAAQALAERSEKDGKMEQALIYWRRTLKLSDNKVLQATCTARGGWVAINLANFKDAETLFRTCLELDPGTDWVKVANSGLLRVYSKTKRYADLLELADPSKENFADKFLPSSLAELLFNLGNASYNLQKYASAVVFYDRYLQEFPKQEGAQAAAYQRLMSHRELEPDSLPTRGAEFLEGWPDSPLVPTVQMLLADYFNRKNEYEKALPYWEKLAEKIPADLQKNAESIVFELGRTNFKLKKWAGAASAYSRFTKEFPKSSLLVSAREQLAISYYNDNKLKESLTVWQVIADTAAPKSDTRQRALEQCGLLEAKFEHKKEMSVYFEQLLSEFPNTSIRAYAAYNVGDFAYDSKDFKKAEPMLLKAREWDPAAMALPCSGMLCTIAYSNKDLAKAITYIKDYEVAAEEKKAASKGDAKPIAPMKAALYFWVAQTAREKGQTENAAQFYTKVTEHVAPGEFLPFAWLALAEEQYKLKQYKESVASFKKYQELQPQYAHTVQVILGLGKSYLAAGQFEDARAMAKEITSTDAESANNAIARLIEADSYFGAGDYDSAAKYYSVLAVVHHDPEITPKAIKGAIKSYQKLGDQKSVDKWKEELRKSYPKEGA